MPNPDAAFASAAGSRATIGLRETLTLIFRCARNRRNNAGVALAIAAKSRLQSLRKRVRNRCENASAIAATTCGYGRDNAADLRCARNRCYNAIAAMTQSLR